MMPWEQSLDALEDYLKGPRFIMEDRGEEILKKQAKLNEQLVDLADIDDPRLDFAVIDTHGVIQCYRAYVF